MDVIEEGWLRTRRLKDGSLEVWSKGWRLEIRALPVVPAVLAVAFLMASAPLVVRVLGAAVLLLVSFIAQRLTKLGIVFSEDGVTVIDVRDTKHIPWDRFLGFVGQRGSDDAHCAIALSDGSTVRFSAMLNAGDGDFYKADPGLSMVDELNRLAERAQGKERPSSEPLPISIERIVLATAPRLLLDPVDDEEMFDDEGDVAATVTITEPVVRIPVDIALGEEPFFDDRTADVSEPEPVPEPLRRPVAVPEPVHMPEPVYVPEPAIFVPEPALIPSDPAASAAEFGLAREPVVPTPAISLVPQGDGTSPGARRLAAFLESQKPDEPLPAPVRRSLLAGLGRRRSERR